MDLGEGADTGVGDSGSNIQAHAERRQAEAQMGRRRGRAGEIAAVAHAQGGPVPGVELQASGAAARPTRSFEPATGTRCGLAAADGVDLRLASVADVRSDNHKCRGSVLASVAAPWWRYAGLRRNGTHPPARRAAWEQDTPRFRGC